MRRSPVAAPPARPRYPRLAVALGVLAAAPLAARADTTLPPTRKPCDKPPSPAPSRDRRHPFLKGKIASVNPVTRLVLHPHAPDEPCGLVDEARDA